MSVSDTSSRVKFVPLALSLDDRLLELEIIIDDNHFWDDREVMRKIQEVYWEARGAWKKWPSMLQMWPGEVLCKIGYAEVSSMLL